MKTKFLLFGTGWRAHFYLRIAKALPDLFEIAMVYTKRPERVSYIESLGFNATCSLSKALSSTFDAAIVASGKEGFVSLMLALSREGVETLSETSFLGFSYEEQEELIDLPGYTLEQYQYVPLYRAIINSLDLIGEVDEMSLSALHNHHAAALARRILTIFDESPVSIDGADFDSSIVKTGSRSGMVLTGEKESYKRKVRMLSFSNGKFFINDFSSNQYHSYLIPNRIEIRGERGVIDERGVSYVSDVGYPIHEDYQIFRDIDTLNQSLSLSHITLGSKVVYKNEFYGVNLNDDEIAISTMLKLYQDGKLDYTIRDGIIDARLGALL